MQLYMSWHIRSFLGFTFLNILYFFKYSCTHIFHRRSIYAFYVKRTRTYQEISIMKVSRDKTVLFLQWEILYWQYNMNIKRVPCVTIIRKMCEKHQTE